MPRHTEAKPYANSAAVSRTGSAPCPQTRAAHWLSALPPDTGRALAIAEPAVMQALLVHALSAPVQVFWTLQVPPLYTGSLTWRDGVWSAQPADTSSVRGLGQHPTLPITVLTAPRRTVGDRGTYLCGERAA